MTRTFDTASERRLAATRAVLLACAGLLAIGAFAPSAHAEDRRDDRRDVHRDVHRRPDFHGHPGYAGGYYPPPPVVYGGPVYAPPPVVIGAPGISINIP